MGKKKLKNRKVYHWDPEPEMKETSEPEIIAEKSKKITGDSFQLIVPGTDKDKPEKHDDAENPVENLVEHEDMFPHMKPLQYMRYIEDYVYLNVNKISSYEDWKYAKKSVERDIVIFGDNEMGAVSKYVRSILSIKRDVDSKAEQVIKDYLDDEYLKEEFEHLFKGKKEKISKIFKKAA